MKVQLDKLINMTSMGKKYKFDEKEPEKEPNKPQQPDKDPNEIPLPHKPPITEPPPVVNNR